MATPAGETNGVEEHLSDTDEVPRVNGHLGVNGDPSSGSQTPETPQHQLPDPPSPEALEELQAFDWEDFEARYKAALLRASEEEKAILKEAESLSKVRTYTASTACNFEINQILVFSGLGCCSIFPRRCSSCEAFADQTALRQLVRGEAVAEAAALFVSNKEPISVLPLTFCQTSKLSGHLRVR